MIIREESDRQVTVNMAQAKTRLRRGLQVGDHVSVGRRTTGPASTGGCSRSRATPCGCAPTTAARSAWQGEGVTVIGYEWTGQDQLRAEYVQQDSSDPSRGGSVAPSASPRGR